MASRAVRRRPPRRAVFFNRHHPPPPRHTVAQACFRHHQACRLSKAADRSRRCLDQTRRHAGLLHLFARTGGRRKHHRRPAGARASVCGGRRSPPARCSAAANSSPKTATCVRCPAISPIPIRGSRVSTVSTRQGSLNNGSRPKRPPLAANAPFLYGPNRRQILASAEEGRTRQWRALWSRTVENCL